MPDRDGSAEAEFCRRFAPRIRLYGLRHLRNEAAAADLEFEEAGRLRDEIRALEQEELGLPVQERRASPMGRSNEGKPGTRKLRYGKTQRKFGR